MWSFVGQAKEKVWIWLALDRDSLPKAVGKETGS
jgi:IS1 family transposase